MFTAHRSFRRVRFDVPDRWGMDSRAGDRRLTRLARRLVRSLEREARPERRMEAIDRFLLDWRRLSVRRRFTRAASPEVRDQIWHFVRNRLARLFGYDPQFLGRILERNGV